MPISTTRRAEIRKFLDESSFRLQKSLREKVSYSHPSNEEVLTNAFTSDELAFLRSQFTDYNIISNASNVRDYKDEHRAAFDNAVAPNPPDLDLALQDLNTTLLTAKTEDDLEGIVKKVAELTAQVKHYERVPAHA